MTTETMTVHKALAERKILDDRIESELEKATFCCANRSSNKKVQGVSIEDFKKNAKSSYDRVSDLISRFCAISKAIHQSNAMTTVVICGETYSIAEAISMKDRGIELKECLLNVLTRQHDAAMRKIQSQNETDVLSKADKFIAELYSSGKDNTDPDDIAKAREDFISKNSYELLDPLNIKAKMEALQDEIDSFSAEVDSALSVSNATTTITIEY